MDILFAGNTAAVSEGFYNAIEKEYRCIVLNESCTKDKLKKRIFCFLNPKMMRIRSIFSVRLILKLLFSFHGCLMVRKDI